MNRKTNNTITRSLDACAESSVSPEIQDKLNLARRNALSQLEQHEKVQSNSNSRWFLPVGVLTMVASIVFVFFVTANRPVLIENNFSLSNEDMLVLAEELTLIEDLHFFEWMLLEET